MALGSVLFFILGGAGRAPQPDKSGCPTACGLRPSCFSLAAELSRVVRFWISPGRRTRRRAREPLATPLDHVVDGQDDWNCVDEFVDEETVQSGVSGLAERRSVAVTGSCV